MESSTPQRRSCFILIIKRLNHTPFQRAIPPACLRHPRAARSPHLPKCPTAEHWPDQVSAETHTCLFQSCGCVLSTHDTVQPFHPQQGDLVTAAVAWQDVTLQQAVVSGSQATQGRSHLKWQQRLKQCLLQPRDQEKPKSSFWPLFPCVLRFGTKCTSVWEVQPTWVLQSQTAVLLYITLKLRRKQIIFPATPPTINPYHYQEHFYDQDFSFHCHLLGSV